MKKISIEELLTWAFTMELPKVGTSEGSGPSSAPSTWGILSDVITLGTMIDKSPNMYGVVSGYVWEGEPHPDALSVGEAVRRLDDRDLDIGDGWNPFPEWEDAHGLIREEVESVARYHRERGGRINGRHVAALVASAAVLRRGPDWTADEPHAVMVMNAGKPAWFVKRKCKDRLGRIVEYEDNGFDHDVGAADQTGEVEQPCGDRHSEAEHPRHPDANVDRPDKLTAIDRDLTCIFCHSHHRACARSSLCFSLSWNALLTQCMLPGSQNNRSSPRCGILWSTTGLSPAGYLPMQRTPVRWQV